MDAFPEHRTIAGVPDMHALEPLADVHAPTDSDSFPEHALTDMQPAPLHDITMEFPEFHDAVEQELDELLGPGRPYPKKPQCTDAIVVDLTANPPKPIGTKTQYKRRKVKGRKQTKGCKRASFSRKRTPKTKTQSTTDNQPKPVQTTFEAHETTRLAKELGVPDEALPQTTCTGRSSYTLTSTNNARIEVLLSGRFKG